MSKINPRIVYCSISNFGQTGPYRDLSGHDINAISFSGVLDLIGEAGGKPAIPMNLVGDYGGAAKDAAIGILAALIARGKTGRGQYLDISIMDSSLPLLAEMILPYYFTSGILFKRGEAVWNGGYPQYNVYETRDGRYITIGCLENWFWANFCRAIGHEEFASYDIVEEVASMDRNKARKLEIFDTVRRIMKTKTMDEWFELLRGQDVPVGKVLTLEETFQNENVLGRQMLLELDDKDEGKIKQVGISIKLSDTPGAVRSLPAMPGQDTDEVLKSLDYDSEEINSMRRDRAVA